MKMNDECKMTNDELPSWDSARLADLTVKVGSGSTPRGGESSYQTTGIPLIRSMNVVFFGFKRKGLAFITQKQAKALDNVTVQTGDVLLNITGASIGRVTVAPADMEGARVNQHVCIIRPSPALDARFLNAFLSGPTMQDFIFGENYGVTRQALTKQQILDFKIPLPPLPEQQRIADKLEAVLGRVDACRARLDRVPALLKRFRQSVLSAATSGRLTAEWRMTNGVNDEWENVPLGSVVDEIKNGLSPKPKEQPPGTPILRISSVRTFQVHQTDIRYLPPSLAVEPYRLRIGDLLFTRYNGSLEFVGVCGLVRTISVKGLVYPDKLIRVRVSKARVMPDWIEIAANSPQARDVIENKARTSAGQTGISGKDLKELLLPIPTIPEQQEIVRRVEDLFAFADRIEARLATAQKTVERLTPATLAKAFRGELIPQDPNDEPASTLLERLQNQPATKPAKATRKTRK
jgi:type I restriction enzyme S subunit